MENLGIFYDHFVYFTAIGNILWSFGISCGLPVLVSCTKKNLATLRSTLFMNGLQKISELIIFFF
jgi:hypothetical protein